jgi:hypothetical protein
MAGAIMQTVRVDRTEGFARTMTDMRTWLDRNGIEPVSFHTRPSRRGGFRVELRFSYSDQADRFAQAFGQPAPARPRRRGAAS